VPWSRKMPLLSVIVPATASVAPVTNIWLVSALPVMLTTPGPVMAPLHSALDGS